LIKGDLGASTQKVDTLMMDQVCEWITESALNYLRSLQDSKGLGFLRRSTGKRLKGG
jgi:hypothetical protein